MKYLSLFSGIGGFELGIKQAYESIHNESKDEGLQVEKDMSSYDSELLQRATCIGFSEIDKYAIQVYNKQFPNHKNYGDITKIKSNSLPDFDLLVGGFPCQSFSIAGKRAGFEDTRGTLFFEIARIIREKQPSLLLLENVKGLLSHDKGRTFRTIISTLDELGYDCQWQVLNSKNFGVPQNRERVFIVGHLRGTSRPEVFPIGGGNPKTLKQIVGGGQGNRVYDIDGVACTQASQAGGQGAKTGLYAVSEKKVINPLKDKTQYGWHFEQNVYDEAGLARTVKAGGGSGNMPKLLKDSKIRRLTPKECERLQGFPYDWTAEGVEGKISDTQRYKMCGNAVTVNVIKAIIKKIITL